MKNKFFYSYTDEISPKWIELLKRIMIIEEIILVGASIVWAFIVAAELDSEYSFLAFNGIILLDAVIVSIYHILSMAMLNFLSNVQLIREEICQSKKNENLPEF